MQGQFDLSLRDASGLEDPNLWLGLSRKEQLEKALGLPEKQHVRTKNLINDNFAGYFYDHFMGGPQVSDPYYRSVDAASLAFLLLMTTDTEPTYTESTNVYNTPSSNTDSMDTDASNGAAKRFILDDADDHLIRSLDSVDGRQGIEFRSRFLYLPFQADSGNPIRSIGVYHKQDPDQGITSSNYSGRIARTRLKDSGGTPITITKTSSQVLLVEWQLLLLNV